jgi:hypothetical protein
MAARKTQAQWLADAAALEARAESELRKGFSVVAARLRADALKLRRRARMSRDELPPASERFVFPSRQSADIFEHRMRGAGYKPRRLRPELVSVRAPDDETRRALASARDRPTRTLKRAPFTRVIFRIDREGSVFALLPENAERGDEVAIFTHHGHTSGPLYESLRLSRAAKPVEYASLLNSLRKVGYRVAILRDPHEWARDPEDRPGTQRVLARGFWPSNRKGGPPREYVVIFDELCPRVTIWERRRDEAAHRKARGAVERKLRVRLPPMETWQRSGEWTLWGTYDLRREFDGDMKRLLEVVRSDVRYESLPIDIRATERRHRGTAKRAWRGTLNDPNMRRDPQEDPRTAEALRLFRRLPRSAQVYVDDLYAGASRGVLDSAWRHMSARQQTMILNFVRVAGTPPRTQDIEDWGAY